MRSWYALMVGTLVFANAPPAFAQTTPAPSPTPAPLTSTPPFTAPGDWVQLPRGFTLTEIKNVLRGPGKGKSGPGIFAQAVLPIPSGIVAAGLVQLRSVLSKSKTKIAATSGSVKMCGSSASVSTVRMGNGKTDPVIETTTLSQRGLTYASVYVRPGGVRDAVLEKALHAACPQSDGSLPDITAPRGWTPLQKGLDFQLGGIWLGNAPFQVMTLLQGQGVPGLGGMADAAPPAISSQKQQVKYHATIQKVKFCGQPGVLVTAQFTVPPGFGMTYSAAVAQGMSGTYLLSYVHPSSYTDAGAQAALRTLCGGAPLPPPSSSPLPFP